MFSMILSFNPTASPLKLAGSMIGSENPTTSPTKIYILGSTTDLGSSIGPTIEQVKALALRVITDNQHKTEILDYPRKIEVHIESKPLLYSAKISIEKATMQ